MNFKYGGKETNCIRVIIMLFNVKNKVGHTLTNNCPKILNAFNDLVNEIKKYLIILFAFNI